MNMNYRIIDLIEPDNGCEGFIPGEKPMVTLILSDDSGSERKVQLPDMLAYRLKWLEDNKIKFELLDIKTDHPDEQTLRKYYAKSGLPLKRFFNTSGTQYRELELSKKLPDMSEDEQFRLLESDGMLVKRPLVVGDNFVLTGFREDEWKDKLI